MKQLWLKFTDENGAPKRVLVEGEKFSVGRHSENDLSIANSALSRKHVQIERFGDVFVLSDLGSSNGTKLNDEELTDPAGIKNGDRLNLGGGLEVEVELIDENQGGEDSEDDSKAGGAESAAAAPVEKSAAAGATVQTSGGGSFSSSLFFVAPLFGLLVLMLVGGLFYAFSGKQEKEIVKNDEDFIYTKKEKDETDLPKNDEPDDPIKSETPEDLPNTNRGIETDTPVTVSTPDVNVPDAPPEVSDEMDKIERNSASFMRKIALNDPRAFLTGKQQEIVKAKINQFRNSAALADNLKSAKRNAAQIEALAKSKSLTPQFLATAALAKLGNSRGDVLATAQGMADVLNDLARNIGNELANDNLLVIAAYEQGVAGQTLEMRNMLQNLVGKFPESSRQIRTIWFLKENDKISESQYEFALRFLAIGTISQNPKDYGVQAEALSF